MSHTNLAERVSGETVPDEGAQRQLAAAMNPPLAAAGLQLRETGAADGYPFFEIVARRSRRGLVRNLIFAASDKPDLRLSDVLDSTIESMSDADKVLVYDRPITTDGIGWRDLHAWWMETRSVDEATASAPGLHDTTAAGVYRQCLSVRCCLNAR